MNTEQSTPKECRKINIMFLEAKLKFQTESFVDGIKTKMEVLLAMKDIIDHEIELNKDYGKYITRKTASNV